MKPKVYATSRDWRALVDELKDAREEFRQHQSIMSPFEVVVVQKDIKARCEAYGGNIIAGARQEWQAKIDYVKSFQKAREDAIAKEIRRWDIAKLGNLMAGYETLVNNVASLHGSPITGQQNKAGEELEKIYREAMQQSDIHQKRAALEVIRTAPGRISESDRENFVTANLLAEEAERELQALRTPPELEAVQGQEKAAIEELLELRKEVAGAGMAVEGMNSDAPFSGGDFARMLRQVVKDDFTGEVAIYDPDAYEVTGVLWKTNPEEIKE